MKTRLPYNTNKAKSKSKATKREREALDWDDELSQRAVNKEFAEEYVRNGHIGAKAVKTIWGEGVYANGSMGLAKKALQMLSKKEVQNLIEIYEQQVTEQITPSLRKVVELRDTSDSEKIQLDASRTILESFDGVQKRHEKLEEKLTTNNILVLNLSEEQLLDRINKLNIEVYGKDGGVTRDISKAGKGELPQEPSVLDGELS